MRDPRLDRLVAPRASEDFAERLGAFIRDRERARARRWRAVAIAAAAVVVAATASAAVLAFGQRTAPRVVDRTVSCPIPIQGGIPVIGIGGVVAGSTVNTGLREAVPGSIGVSTTSAARPLVWIQSSKREWTGSPDMRRGWFVDEEICDDARRIPLTHDRLRFDGRFRSTASGRLTGPSKRCFVGTSATFRLHITFGKNNLPVTATLVVLSGKRLRPVAYLDWKPTTITSYFSSDCYDR